MNLNSEIYKYISKTFLFSTGILIVLFASIIFIGDAVEFGKKLSSNSFEFNFLYFLVKLFPAPEYPDFESMIIFFLLNNFDWSKGTKGNKIEVG